MLELETLILKEKLTARKEKIILSYEKVREVLRLRNYSHKTIKSYISCLRGFVKYFKPKHPRKITNEDIKKYLLYLIEEKKWQASTIHP